MGRFCAAYGCVAENIDLALAVVSYVPAPAHSMLRLDALGAVAAVVSAGYLANLVQDASLDGVAACCTQAIPKLVDAQVSV